MPVYGKRTEPAYGGGFSSPPERARNPHILAWWQPEYDDLIRRLAEDYAWGWPPEFTRSLEAIAPAEVLTAWAVADPICRTYASYNVLMYFAIARATVIGLRVRAARWRVCPVCNERFLESSLPQPFLRRLGQGNLDVCSPCLEAAVFGRGDENMPRARVLSWLCDFQETLQRVPAQDDLGRGMALGLLSPAGRAAVVRFLQGKPALSRVRELFTTWLGALVAAGLLEGGMQPMMRGIRCLAHDGHVCLSLGEKAIDDLLFALRIPHEREPHYPRSNYRGDFLVGDIFIEFFGLAGDSEYDRRCEEKRRIATENGIPLIELVARDVVNITALRARLCKELGYVDLGASAVSRLTAPPTT